MFPRYTCYCHTTSFTPVFIKCCATSWYRTHPVYQGPRPLQRVWALAVLVPIMASRTSLLILTVSAAVVGRQRKPRRWCHQVRRGIPASGYFGNRRSTWVLQIIQENLVERLRQFRYSQGVGWRLKLQGKYWGVVCHSQLGGYKGDMNIKNVDTPRSKDTTIFTVFLPLCRNHIIFSFWKLQVDQHLLSQIFISQYFQEWKSFVDFTRVHGVPRDSRVGESAFCEISEWPGDEPGDGFPGECFRQS